MINKVSEPGKLNTGTPTNNLVKVYTYLYVLITYILCFATTIFVPVDPGYKMLLKQSQEIGLKTPAAALFFSLCLLLLFFLQYKLIGSFTKKKALFILILVAVVYFVSLPFFSSDVFLYAFKGKIQAELSLNPYEPVKYFETPYIYLSPWALVPLAYGPLANFVFKIFYFKGLSPFMDMYILKAVFLVFFIAILWLAYKVCLEKNFVFFILSPIVLIEGVLNAHLDMMPLLFLILSCYFLKKENYPLNFLFLGIAASFKFTYALFILPFFLEGLRKKRWFFFDILFFAFPVLLSILLFPGISKYPDAVKFVASLDSISWLKLFAGIKLGKYFFTLAAGLALFYFFSLYWRRKIDVLRFCYILYLFSLLFDRIFQPWHIFPIYAIKLFLKNEKFDYLGFISMIGVYAVFFVFYEWNALQNFISTLFILPVIIYSIVAELIEIKKNIFFKNRDHAG